MKQLLTSMPLFALLACNGGAPHVGATGETRAPSKTHEFSPVAFFNEFSATTTPVLRISPGDSVRTTTIDAGGSDKDGVSRGRAGNPQTGPFFIIGSAPGDTVAVHLTRLRLNRDWAISTDTLSDRAKTTDLASRMTFQGQIVRWRLDTTRGVAVRDRAPDNLAAYAVPLKPMLGCIALAPPPSESPRHTGHFGPWGGNLDFNELVEGTTVYLPVHVPGGLLYLGDAHAAQGDGEMSGNGLETSMDVEVRVELLAGHGIPAPRVASSTHVMTMGLSSSLDDAMREATTNMVDWLLAQYQLTLPEVSQLIGTSAEYRVSVAVGDNAGIVLKLPKDRLRSLRSTDANGAKRNE